MARKMLLVCLCIFATGLVVWAGDVAQFADLGFSPDGRYFMFGEYGILQKTSAPWASLFVVDVGANAFVPQGVQRVSYTQPAEPGASGLGALLNVVTDGSALKRKYCIDYLLTGRILYLAVDGAPAGQPVEFRDFVTGRSYAVTLEQVQHTRDGQPAASFSIKVSITEATGATRQLAVGNPALERAGVRSYLLRQVILGPESSSLVFVVQKEEVDTQGSNVRYMVETTAGR
jgi:predicted secreted protein